MGARKPFALRVDEKTLNAMQHWANDDLRSLNAQIEFVLRNALADAGRLKANRASFPLFDTARFTRHLEAAYARMVERHRSGEPPAAFAVDALDDRHG